MSAVTRIGAGVAALALVLGAAACADTTYPPPGPTTGSPTFSPGPMMRPPTGVSGGDVDDANRGPGGMMGGYPTTATAVPHVGSVAGEGLDRAAEISLQAAVDQGAQPWRLEPQMVALAFTRARFGWMMPRTEPLAAGSVTVDDGAGGAISLRLYQPARTGPGGIWTVTGEHGCGDVGVAWLRHTCGRCRYCRRGAENLCPDSRYTGWDADGGYAERTVAPAAFVHRLPEGYSDVELAPLLCAGIIGFRALRRSGLPDGGRLGIYGFGGSAHLAAQVALAEGATVHVMTRSPDAQRLARELGSASAQGAADPPPESLDAAILFAPAGELVLPALEALDRGGTLAVAGIHLSDVPPLDYQRHLFQERSLRSVTSNTRTDAREFLATAARHRLEVTTMPYALDEAGRALADLAADRITGAAVLVP